MKFVKHITLENGQTCPADLDLRLLKDIGKWSWCGYFRKNPTLICERNSNFHQRSNCILNTTIDRMKDEKTEVKEILLSNKELMALSLWVERESRMIYKNEQVPPGLTAKNIEMYYRDGSCIAEDKSATMFCKDIECKNCIFDGNRKNVSAKLKELCSSKVWLATIL